MKNGLIHVYYGDGKGKTTAATGLAVRAAGSGRRVLMLQFLKGRSSGEVEVLRSIPGVSLERAAESKKFTWDMSPEELEAARRQNDEAFLAAAEKAREIRCDLLVLDEALGAFSAGVLSESLVIDFLREKPEGLELVLTGRDPSAALLEIADYATEMRKVKHPYDKGVQARQGIEY